MRKVLMIVICIIVIRIPNLTNVFAVNVLPDLFDVPTTVQILLYKNSAELMAQHVYLIPVILLQVDNRLTVIGILLVRRVSVPQDLYRFLMKIMLLVRFVLIPVILRLTHVVIGVNVLYKIIRLSAVTVLPRTAMKKTQLVRVLAKIPV
jgi:hypothetical protein